VEIAAPGLVKLAQARAERLEISGTACWRYRVADAVTEANTAPMRILLVHGFRGDHHGLEAIAGGLSAFEVVIPDLPGYGKTPPLAEQHDLAGYRDWLIALNRELQADLVVGHSFGSLVVSAAGDELNARGLALINPVATRSGESKTPANRLARSYYRLAERGGWAGSVLLRNQLAVRAMSLALTTSMDPSLRSWIHRSHHRYFSNFSPDRVAFEGFWAAANNSTLDFAGDIATRTLVIAAARDQISKVAEVRALHERLHDSELTVLTKVGHLLHYERPAQVAALLASFASELANDD
jgi:pimeloyl-ACP methyl ester carboxylesterase